MKEKRNVVKKSKKQKWLYSIFFTEEEVKLINLKKERNYYIIEKSN